MANRGYRFVTIDEVVTSGQIALGLTTDKDRNIMREWAWLAVKQIGLSHQISKKEECVDIKDFAFDKPCDMVSPVSVRLHGSNTSDGVYYPSYDTGRFDNDRPEDQGNSRYVTIEEQTDQFVISSKGGNFSKATIQYYSLPVDSDGTPLIPEYYQRAIMSYIEYMFVKRERRRTSRNDKNEIPMSEVDFYHRQWMRLRAEAEAEKAIPNEMVADEIVSEWQTLLPNQRKLRKNTLRRFFFGGISV